MYVLGEYLTGDCSCIKKIFLKKLLWRFVVHISTILLAPFASKLVNFSRQGESFNIRNNSEIDDIFLRRQLIIDFRTYSKTYCASNN